jgi:hypothetical protein
MHAYIFIALPRNLPGCMNIQRRSSCIMAEPTPHSLDAWHTCQQAEGGVHASHRHPAAQCLDMLVCHRRLGTAPVPE